MAKRQLRAVKADEKPAPIKSLADAIERGTHEDVLVWQRKDAVRELPNTKGQAYSALQRQITVLTDKIEALRAAKTEGTDIGEAIETPDAKFDAEAL